MMLCMRDALAERHGRPFGSSARRGPMGARPDVDALTPVKFPKCFGLSRKRYPGSIRQLIMDRGMLWNFDRARTFRPMVFNGYRQATVAAVFETPAKTSFLFDLDGTLVWSTASISPCWSGGRRFRRRESNSGRPAEAHRRGGPQARRRCLAAGWCANGHSSKPAPCNIAHHRQLSTLDRRQRRPCFLMHAI
jgi:hypothetical protein